MHLTHYHPRWHRAKRREKPFDVALGPREGSNGEKKEETPRSRRLHEEDFRR